VTYRIIQCPQTGLKVQTSIPVRVEAEDDGAFESFKCLACGQIHYINVATGELMGERKAKT
jgi:hypothetical protein